MPLWDAFTNSLVQHQTAIWGCEKQKHLNVVNWSILTNSAVY